MLFRGGSKSEGQRERKDLYHFFFTNVPCRDPKKNKMCHEAGLRGQRGKGEIGTSWVVWKVLVNSRYHGGHVLCSRVTRASYYTCFSSFRWSGSTCKDWDVTRCCKDLPSLSKWEPPKKTLITRSPFTRRLPRSWSLYADVVLCLEGEQRSLLGNGPPSCPPSLFVNPFLAFLSFPF